jgi:hypothetical protein
VAHGGCSLIAPSSLSIIPKSTDWESHSQARMVRIQGSDSDPRDEDHQELGTHAGSLGQSEALMSKEAEA